MGGNVDESVALQIGSNSGDSDECVAVPTKNVMGGNVGESVVLQIGSNSDECVAVPTKDVGEDDVPATQVQVQDDVDSCADFVIPRARGRPKIKSKAKRAKQKASAQYAKEASQMYHEQVSLATMHSIMCSDATFNTAKKVVEHFGLFEIKKETKQPRPFKLDKRSKNKSMPVKDLSRVLPKSMLSKCASQIIRLQRETPGLAENQVAIQVPEIGVFDSSTLNDMRTCHCITERIKQIEFAIDWADSVDVKVGESLEQVFQVSKHMDIVAALKSIQLQTEKVNIVDFAGRMQLSDAALHFALESIFQDNTRVVGVLPSLTGAIGLDDVDKRIRVMLSKDVTDYATCPLLFGSNHWCCVFARMSTQEICYYDPMSSSNAHEAYRFDKFRQILLTNGPAQYRIRRFDTAIGSQLDNYNCGIYVIVAAESFVHEKLMELYRVFIDMGAYLIASYNAT